MARAVHLVIHCPGSHSAHAGVLFARIYAALAVGKAIAGTSASLVDGPGCQKKELLRLPAVQGKVNHSLVVYKLADGARASGQHFCVGGNVDFLGHSAHLQGNGLAGSLVHRQDEARLHVSRKTRLRNRQLVMADGERRKQKCPVRLRRYGPRKAGIFILHRDLSLRDDGSRRVCNGTTQAGSGVLRSCRDYA